MTMVVEITPSCLDAIRSAYDRMPMSAFGVLAESSFPLPNGNREIVIQDDTAAALIRVQLAGETLSDTIQRLCRRYGRSLH